MGCGHEWFHPTNYQGRWSQRARRLDGNSNSWLSSQVDNHMNTVKRMAK